MSTDSHEGGTLSSMAENGTTIPNDAGVQNIIKSVPNPSQDTSASAASNATDIPRRNMDIGARGDVLTGTGDELPAAIETKRLHMTPNEPLSKGHDRYEKHHRENKSDEERLQSHGPGVDRAPGEDEDEEEVLRDRRDGKQ